MEDTSIGSGHWPKKRNTSSWLGALAQEKEYMSSRLRALAQQIEKKQSQISTNAGAHPLNHKKSQIELARVLTVIIRIWENCRYVTEFLYLFL